MLGNKHPRPSGYGCRCYTYTTVWVWYCSYYTSTRRSRVHVLITYIIWETEINTVLRICWKQDWDILIEQSVGLSVHPTDCSIGVYRSVLFKQAYLCPTTPFMFCISLYQVLNWQQRIWTEVWIMRVCELLSIIIVVWHHPHLRYKASEGSGLPGLYKGWCFEHNRLILAAFEHKL